MTTSILHHLEKRRDELARRYHETHDPKVKAELPKLSWRVTALRG